MDRYFKSLCYTGKKVPKIKRKVKHISIPTFLKCRYNFVDLPTKKMLSVKTHGMKMILLGKHQNVKQKVDEIYIK